VNIKFAQNLMDFGYKLKHEIYFALIRRIDTNNNLLLDLSNYYQVCINKNKITNNQLNKKINHIRYNGMENSIGVKCMEYKFAKRFDNFDDNIYYNNHKLIDFFGTSDKSKLFERIDNYINKFIYN
jgi:RNase adaptor protein for sRNA GlmZ degradation